MDNLIDQFNLLKEEDQEEIRTLVKERLEDTLINILDSLGFEGVDISLNMSLFGYGVLYNPRTKQVVLYRKQRFDIGEVSDGDIESSIQEINEGFFSYIDIDKSEYLDLFKNSDNKARIIKDLLDFCNWGEEAMGFSYNLNMVDLVRKVRGLLK